MGVIITNRAKKSIKDLYWISTRKNPHRTQETQSLVDAMVSLVTITPLVISKDRSGILGIWKDKGYTIFESTHYFTRRSNGIEFKQMTSRKNLKRKWYFACIVDSPHNTVYIVNAIYAKYIDRMMDDTPSAVKFMSAVKGLETKRKKRKAANLQRSIPFDENNNQFNCNRNIKTNKNVIRLTESDLYNIIAESMKRVLRESANKIIYHYCSAESLRKMIKTDAFYFSPNEKDYSNGYNYMSATRMRNSKQGFAYMQTDSGYGGTIHYQPSEYALIRVELDADAVQRMQYQYRKKHYSVKVSPFDYIYHTRVEDGEEPISGKHEAMRAFENGESFDDLDYYYGQPFSQAEERLYSKKTSIKGFSQCVKRIDICLRHLYDANDMDSINEILSAIDLKHYSNYPQWENKIFYYSSQDSFNLQIKKGLLTDDELKKIYLELYDLKQRLME